MARRDKGIVGRGSRRSLANPSRNQQERLFLLDAELLSQLRTGATVMARVQIIERSGKYVELLEVS